jgi:hypothetical protein
VILFEKSLNLIADIVPKTACLTQSESGRSVFQTKKKYFANRENGGGGGDDAWDGGLLSLL